MDQSELKKVLALASGLQRGLTPGYVVETTVWDSFVALVKRAEAVTGEDFSALKTYRRDPDMEAGYISDWVFRPKLSQLVSFLEALNEQDAVVEIGTLFNSIKDEELRARCADLLSAKSRFDRVINQATLVLEDRIRKKSQAAKSLVGVKLVNEVIKAKPEDSILVISNSAEEQEGVANICRGLMQALRNETHHHLVEGFSREEAFHICGFIDRILKLIDNAKVQAK